MTDPLPPDLADVAALLQRAALDEAPPASVRARAVALGGTVARLQRDGKALLRRLVALAVPGPEASGFAPAWGVRGAADAGSQWLFRVEEFEIDLRTAARGETWALTGQLFGMPQATRVELQGPQQARVLELGPTFEFTFDALPPGAYRLLVQGGDCEILVPGLEVGTADRA